MGTNATPFYSAGKTLVKSQKMLKKTEKRVN